MSVHKSGVGALQAALDLAAQPLPLPELLRQLMDAVSCEFAGGATILSFEDGREAVLSTAGSHRGPTGAEAAGPLPWLPEDAWQTPVTGQRGIPLGTLWVGASRAATAPERRLLTSLAQIAALLIERDDALGALTSGAAALHSARQQTESLMSLGDSLQLASTPDAVAERALAQIGPTLGAQSMLVVRLGDEGIRLPTLWGDMPEVVMRHMTRPGLTLEDTPVLRQVALERRGLYLDDYLGARSALQHFPALALGVEPLCMPDGTLQGFLVIWRPPRAGAWRDDERSLMRRAADTLGLALERAERQAQLARQSRQLRQNNLDLQRERTFLHAVLANLSEGVVACDETGALTLFNDATRIFHGLDASPVPPEEWASQFDLFEGDGVTPLTTEQVPLYRAWRGETVRDADIVIRPRLGRVRQLLASGQPMFTPDGEPLGAVVTMRDVTARRAAQQELGERNAQLLRSNAELRAANDELEAFTYSASHDLKTPVRHINSFAELARRAISRGQTDNAAAHLTRIEAASTRMATLIDALLVLARSSKQELSLDEVALGELVRGAIHELGPDLVDREVEWRVGALPVVAGDQATLHQAVSNVLANAVKFSRGRAPALIEVWAVEHPAHWTVKVRDNGVGFDPAYQARLFGAFQRLHSESEFEGAGVGLATVRRILLRHGGDVSAEGQPGQGATISLSLPRQVGGAAR